MEEGQIQGTSAKNIHKDEERGVSVDVCLRDVDVVGSDESKLLIGAHGVKANPVV